MQGTQKRTRPEWRDVVENQLKRNRVDLETDQQRKNVPQERKHIKAPARQETAISGSFRDRLEQDSKETDPARLAARKKQIDLGKCTPGYQRYIKEVPYRQREFRNPMHPKTPDRTKNCSKRSWDGQIKIWRRALHQWDPPQENGDVVMGIGEMSELASLMEAEEENNQSYQKALTSRPKHDVKIKEKESDEDSCEVYDASHFNDNEQEAFEHLWEEFPEF